MAIFRKRFLFLILITFQTVASSGQKGKDATLFSVEELQNDFKYLRNRYENELANVYLYVSKQNLDMAFDSLYQNLSPMTAMEFYSYITPLSSVIKDGHSNLFPPADLTDYYNKNSTFFPFTIYWTNNKMFVLKNLSADTTILPGAEIISINGKEVQEIMDFLLRRQVRDGMNENYANWILNSYFREYYSYHFGHPQRYELGLKTNSTSSEIKNVAALSKEQIKWNNQTRNTEIAGPEIDLQIDTVTSTVTFSFKSWDTKGLSKEIERLFTEIEKKQIKNLVLDVRDNQGGDFKPAILMLSYLLDQPFEYFTEVKSVSRATVSSQVLRSETGNMLGIHQPQKNVFKGKLYVLINGGSFSNTASFCSRIKFYKRGVLIGEETGGNATVFSGVFGLRGSVTLTNTKIVADNSNYRMTVTDINENTGRGVLPDVPVRNSISNLIDDIDVVMQATKNLIKN